MDAKQLFFKHFCELLTKLDPEVFEPLKIHQSKILHLEIKEVLSLYIQISVDELILLPDTPTPDCHTVLSGQLSDFMFAANPDPSSLRRGNLNLKGDLALAQTFSECLQQIDCDWEGFFADKIGDNAAHFCGRILQKATATLKDLAKRRGQDLVYFAQDERSLVPYQEDVQIFYDEVDRLKCDVERFEMKLKRLL